MTEYKLGYATVRIHGNVNRDNVKAATERFVKKAMMQKKRRVQSEARKEAYTGAEDTDL